MKSAVKTLLGAILLLAFTRGFVSAHEVRPAYLQMRQMTAEKYEMVWKVPAIGDRRLALHVQLPDNCSLVGTPSGIFTADAFIERSNISCSGGLAGKKIYIDGLSSTVIDVLVRVERSDGTKQIARILASDPSFVVEAASTRMQAAVTYLRLGVDHILLGIDHLLFVLGLLLIVKDRWMLLKTISSFTLAHSITLAIATLGYASAPIPPLNSAIALSILFLGPEIVRKERGETSLTIRHPWVVAFAFGLLHGFGFASGLTSLGLPRTEIPLALLLFNVGVELGQLFFVLIIVQLGRSFHKLEIRWPCWAEAVPAYSIGTLGAFWTIQRTVLMLGIWK